MMIQHFFSFFLYIVFQCLKISSIESNEFIYILNDDVKRGFVYNEHI